MSVLDERKGIKTKQLLQCCETGLMTRAFNYNDTDTITKEGGRAKVDDLWRIHRTMVFRGVSTYPILDNVTGEYTVMTQSELKRLCNEMDAFGCDSFQQLATKAAQVSAATTAEQINIIAWE